MGAIVKEQLEAGAHRPKYLAREKIFKSGPSLVDDALCFNEVDELYQFFGCNAVVAKQDFYQGNESLQLEEHLGVALGSRHVLLCLGFDFLCTLCQPSFLVYHCAD
jgi:hypothetical protein